MRSSGESRRFRVVLIGLISLGCLAGYVYWLADRSELDLWSLRQAALGLVAFVAVPVGYLSGRRRPRLNQRRRDNGARPDPELPRLILDKNPPTAERADPTLTTSTVPAIDEPHPIELAVAAVRIDTRENRSRYIEAAAQLGHDKAAIRLAGVYAMAQLADDWGDADPVQRQTCIDVLCGYLRLPIGPYVHVPADLAGPHARPDHGDNYDPAEVQVRETVVRIITQHLQPAAPHSWSDADFDFSGAHFPEDIARFDGVEFAGQHTSFDRACFSGAETSFNRARFSGNAASFSGATFAAAQTSFDLAAFSAARTSFDRTNFSGRDASFHDATFSSASTSFDLASFAGRDISFDMATFSGARTSFEAANFACPRTSFFGASFAGEFATFGGARFSGADSTFYLAKFCGERLSFLGARFSGAHTSFNVVVGDPTREATSAVSIHAQIESVLDFSDAQEEGPAELDLSGAEIVGAGRVIAPKNFSGWLPPPSSA